MASTRAQTCQEEQEPSVRQCSGFHIPSFTPRTSLHTGNRTGSFLNDTISTCVSSAFPFFPPSCWDVSLSPVSWKGAEKQEGEAGSPHWRAAVLCHVAAVQPLFQIMLRFPLDTTVRGECGCLRVGRGFLAHLLALTVPIRWQTGSGSAA